MTSTSELAGARSANEILAWVPGEGSFRPDEDRRSARFDIADSWLVVDGAVRGLGHHRDRFVGSCAACHGVPVDVANEFFTAACAMVPSEGRWFPRVEYSRGTGFRVRVRPTAAAAPSVALGLFGAPDPRRRPTVKGPDLELLIRLRARASAISKADEVLLVSKDGIVLEGSLSSVLWWRGDVLCAPAMDLPVLPGVTRRLVLNMASDLGVEVRFERCTPKDLNGLEVWCLSALHGIRFVASWVGTGFDAAPPRRAMDWQAALARIPFDESGGKCH